MRTAILLLALLAACTESGDSGANTAAAVETNALGNETMANAADAPADAAAPPGSDEPADNSGRTEADVPIKTVPGVQRAQADTGDAGDACGASRYRYLVGQHRSRIPARPSGETWRVTCTSCPMTMDYSERRLNILYDQETEIVEAVRCG